MRIIYGQPEFWSEELDRWWCRITAGIIEGYRRNRFKSDDHDYNFGWAELNLSLRRGSECMKAIGCIKPEIRHDVLML